METIFSDPLQLPSFYKFRGLKQYYQSWIAWATYPRCALDRVQEIRRRVRQGGKVESICRCGKIKIWAVDAPRLVTVCHCSVCRNDEAMSLSTTNAPAPSFAAVRRETCLMTVDGEAKLIWRESSEFARRARCSICDTSLIMDYEWLEPSTIWLVRPTWKKNGEGQPEDVERVFNGGLADLDVCWNSRSDPCSSVAKVSYLGEEGVREKNFDCTIEPRGVFQCDDLDWTQYYLDCGSLVE